MSPTDESDRGDPERPTWAPTDPEPLELDAIVERAAGDVEARADAADALGTLAVGSSSVPGEAVTALERLLRDEDAKVRSTAATSARQFARVQPDVASSLVPALIDRLDDDAPSVRNNALAALASVPPSAAGALAPAIPALEPFLRSEFAVVRERAISVLAAAASTTPGDAAALLPAVLDCLAEPRDDPDPDVQHAVDGDDVRAELVEGANEVRLRSEEARASAARVLATVARERPDAVEDVVPRLGAILAAESVVPARIGIVDVLALVAAERPDAVRPLAEELGRILRDGETPELRATAARALSNVAEAYPEVVATAVRPGAASLVALLDGDDPYVRASAAGLVSYVAEVDPGALGAAVDPLIDGLEDDRAAVRGSAALALGALGGDPGAAELRASVVERAVAELRSLESGDPDADVREAAAEALAAIGAGQG